MSDTAPAQPEPVSANPLDPAEPVSNITEPTVEADYSALSDADKATFDKDESLEPVTTAPGDSSVPAEPPSNIPPGESTDVAADPTAVAPADPSTSSGSASDTVSAAPSPGGTTPVPSGTGDPVVVPTPVVPDPGATAADAIDAANAHPTVTNPPPSPLAGAPMSDETHAWIEANGPRVWVISDPA